MTDYADFQEQLQRMQLNNGNVIGSRYGYYIMNDTTTIVAVQLRKVKT